MFGLLLRNIGVPLSAIFLLSQTALGLQGAFLAVAIVLTIANILSIFIQLFKIFGNALTLRGGRVIVQIFSIIFEIVTVVLYWLYYFIYIR
jgi:apolipoprotein N-acyltransferase